MSAPLKRDHFGRDQFERDHFGRDHFETERANPASADLDRMSVADAFDVMNGEDAKVAIAVAAAKDAIVRTVEIAAERLARGGRLIYVGAGTSGRLAVVDASECPPTFQTDPEMVQGVIAGGERAFTRAVEGAEDSREAGALEVRARNVGANDVVMGIAAGGTTPFVHGAIAEAKLRGAATVFFACVPREQAPDEADVSIRVVTGPEVIAGSTRLKAGTATKLVLNLVSTLTMVRLGKVYGHWMVDVNTRGNAKLWQRGIALVARLVAVDADDRVDRARAEELLNAADGRVKVAVLMGRLGLDRASAEKRLLAANGFLRRALEAT